MKETAQFTCQVCSQLLTPKNAVYLAKMGNFHPILVLQGSFPTFLRLPSPIPASVCAYRRRGGHKRNEKDAASNFEVKSVFFPHFF